jgi:hypothetical protein
LSFTNAAIVELESRLREDFILPAAAFPHFVGTFDKFIWQFLFSTFGIPGCAVLPHLIPDKDKRAIRPFEKAQSLPLSCFDHATGEMIAKSARGHGFDPDANTGRTKAYVTSARLARGRFLARGEVDFADVRKIANEYLADNLISKRLGAALSARFREIIVDEAQDCNPTDLEIIDWLRNAGIVTKIICDPHQSIYEFRGGVTKHLIEFGMTFDESDRLPMKGNFRSSQNICDAIAMLRPLNARGTSDLALGEHKAESTHIFLLAYSGNSVPSTIGIKFQELVRERNLEASDCPVIAATRQSAAKAIGQQAEADSQDLTIRLAIAIIKFHGERPQSIRRSAMEDVHKVVLEIGGRIEGKTYHQFIAAEKIDPDDWRPQIIRIIRELRYSPETYTTPVGWLDRARALLARYLPTGGPSIARRLRYNAALETVLVAASPSDPPARTIHSVKGMQFPAVCVVMTAASAKGILDYLEAGHPEENAEDARKIYVAASRAQRLLTIAVPKSQSDRLLAHIAVGGAQVTMIVLQRDQAQSVNSSKARTKSLSHALVGTS